VEAQWRPMLIHLQQQQHILQLIMVIIVIMRGIHLYHTGNGMIYPIKQRTNERCVTRYLAQLTKDGVIIVLYNNVGHDDDDD
jgi:hypothetical protein